MQSGMHDGRAIDRVNGARSQTAIDARKTGSAIGRPRRQRRSPRRLPDFERHLSLRVNWLRLRDDSCAGAGGQHRAGGMENPAIANPTMAIGGGRLEAIGLRKWGTSPSPQDRERFPSRSRREGQTTVLLYGRRRRANGQSPNGRGHRWTVDRRPANSIGASEPLPMQRFQNSPAPGNPPPAIQPDRCARTLYLDAAAIARKSIVKRRNPRRYAPIVRAIARGA